MRKPDCRKPGLTRHQIQTQKPMPNHSQLNHSQSQQLTAEIVSIGDEMTGGARLDTNAQWLSRRLQDLGIEVLYHSTVGDTLSHNIDVFKIASSRVDIVVSTGGLGPTRDDLTREALAGVADQPLQLRQDALEHIQNMFARRNREMPDRNQLQAMFPVGSDSIHNPQGTAPGVDLAVPRGNRDDCRIFSLPGVPAEMKRMFDETVAPRIMDISGGSKCISQYVMKFFGTGESDMERRLGDMIARNRQPRVGITVSAATISLRITATADTQQACDQMIDTTRAEILTKVGDLHFGDGESFEQYHTVDEMLSQRDQRLAVIELGSAAPLAGWFASLTESENYQGGVSFATSAALLEFTSSKDIETAMKEMKKQFSADWVIMVDQYPTLRGAQGKQGGESPLPAADFTVQIMTPRETVYQHTQSLGGHPSILQQRIAKAALQYLRKVISEDNRSPTPERGTA